MTCVWTHESECVMRLCNGMCNYMYINYVIMKFRFQDLRMENRKPNRHWGRLGYEDATA